MNYSLNQIEMTCRKAVRGAGLNWSVAEEAGRAVRWLEMMQLQGVALLVRLLREIDHSVPERLTVKECNTWVVSKGAISPLMAGPSIGDLINAINPTENRENNSIRLEEIAFPLLCVGYAGVAAVQENRRVSLEWGGAHVICNSKMINIGVCRQGLTLMSTPGMTIHIGNEDVQLIEGEILRAEAVSREVESPDWSELQSFAQRTYVKATDASRLTGAGAGTSDND